MVCVPACVGCLDLLPHENGMTQLGASLDPKDLVMQVALQNEVGLTDCIPTRQISN